MYSEQIPLYMHTHIHTHVHLHHIRVICGHQSHGGKKASQSEILEEIYEF